MSIDHSPADCDLTRALDAAQVAYTTSMSPAAREAPPPREEREAELVCLCGLPRSVPAAKALKASSASASRSA